MWSKLHMVNAHIALGKLIKGQTVVIETVY